MTVCHRKLSGSRAAAAVALLCALARPATADDVWPGAGRGVSVGEVTLPAGALPPGPAVIEIETPRPMRFKARFAMPASGPARVRLWDDETSAGEPEIDVVARGAGGATWRTRIARPVGRGETRSAARFLGSADQMAALVNAVDSPDARTALTGVELGSRAELQLPDCRRLAHARVVVAVLASDESPGPLLACVGRGAGILIIGGLPEPDLDGARAIELAVPEPVAWGLGAVVRAAAITPHVGNAIAAIDKLERAHQLVNDGYGSDFRDNGRIYDRDGVPGVGVLLVLLALYVVVIGPLGYFVGVRPRRPLLAWCWFPLVALGATVALVLASAAWRSDPTKLYVTRVRVTSPSGVGLETTDLELFGHRAGRFAVTVAEVADADLSRTERGFRFGTPFASPAGALTVTDDRTLARMTFGGLTMGRFGSAGAGFIAPVTGAAVRFRSRDGRAVVVNATDRPVRRAVVIRGAEGCRVDGPIPPRGEAPLGHCGPVTSDESQRDWFLSGVDRVARVALSVDGYALVAELDAPAAAAVVEPDAVVVARAVQIVVGVDPSSPVPR